MTSEDLSIRVHAPEGGPQVYEIGGVLDIATSPTIRAALMDASERGLHRLVVDLTNVEFIDSTGLGAIIGSQRRAKENGGSVALVAPEGQILRLLRITGLTGIFDCYPTLDAALSGGPLVAGL